MKTQGEVNRNGARIFFQALELIGFLLLAGLGYSPFISKEVYRMRRASECKASFVAGMYASGTYNIQPEDPVYITGTNLHLSHAYKSSVGTMRSIESIFFGGLETK